MIKVDYAIIVEGKYDKIKLSSFINGTIVETNGFRIFKDPKKINMIKKLAESVGIVVLTDSDASGFMIRNYLKNVIKSGVIKHAYVPDIYGKERRKSSHSKEGKLGVEGVPKDIIIKSLEAASREMNSQGRNQEDTLTKTDLFLMGLCGCDGSVEKRKRLISYLKLPEHISSNSLLDILNSTIGKQKFGDITKYI